MNQTLVLILIGAVALAALLYPLLRGGPARNATRPARGPAPDDAPDTPDELAELEADFAMGRLGEADYVELRRRALSRLESSVAGIPAPPLVVTRAAGPPLPDSTTVAPDIAVGAFAEVADEAAEALVRRFASRPRVSCAACGERPEPDARFCSSCGATLAACPACGSAIVEVGALFCSACGTPLSA